MKGLLAGDTVVVTGGASGIGRGICLAYAESGADVVVADVRSSPKGEGAPTHEIIANETDSRATFVECDVTDVADLQACMDAAEEYGGVDVLVNNAGIWREEDFLNTTEKEYDEIMGINTKGIFFGSQAAAKRMVDAGGGGSIVNISSVGGLLGNGAFPIYSMSKGAVRLLSYALADALGPHDIRVNAIHPGTIDTMIGGGESSDEDTESDSGSYIEGRALGRTGEPADIAGVAVFLASDMAAYVTGTSVVVDGGYTYTF